MSIYDQIARGFNVGEGGVKAAMYRKQDEQNKLAQQLQQRQLGLQERRLGMQESKIQQDQLEKVRQNMLKAVAWADTPEKWMQAVQHYQSQGIPIPPEFANVTPDNFEQVRGMALASLMSSDQVAARAQPKYEFQNVGTGQPGETRLNAINPYTLESRPVGGVKKGKQSGTLVTLPDGTVVATGDSSVIKDARQSLTKPEQSKVQQKIMDGLSQIQQLQNAGSSYADDYLTYFGKAKAIAARTANKAGFNLDNKFLGDFTKFTTRVERFFNSYRKEITGAAASVQELRMLRKSVINGDMSPAEFKAALSSLLSDFEQQLRQQQGYATSGVPVGGQESQQNGNLQPKRLKYNPATGEFE